MLIFQQSTVILAQTLKTVNIYPKVGLCLFNSEFRMGLWETSSVWNIIQSCRYSLVYFTLARGVSSIQLQILLVYHYASKLSFYSSEGTRYHHNPCYIHALPDTLGKLGGPQLGKQVQRLEGMHYMLLGFLDLTVKYWDFRRNSSISIIYSCVQVVVFSIWFFIKNVSHWKKTTSALFFICQCIYFTFFLYSSYQE